MYYTYQGDRLRGVIAEKDGPSGVGQPIGSIMLTERDRQSITKITTVEHQAFACRGVDQVSEAFTGLRDQCKVKVSRNDNGSVSLRSVGATGDDVLCADDIDSYWDFDIPTKTAGTAGGRKQTTSKPTGQTTTPTTRKPSGDKQTAAFTSRAPSGV